MDKIRCDFLIVGAGVAGLRAAIEAAEAGSVLVVAKDRLQESSSEYAQGGIAVALSDDDEVGLHEQDTITAGAGLCNREAVRVLVEEGPRRIQELMDWGAAFDREGARLLFTREGAHSRSRVLHAHGDSTGREIVRTLYRRAAQCPNIRFQSFAAVTDLIRGADGVMGATASDMAGREIEIQARAVLLATGGLGRVFSETTNPDVATGDGVAVAFRAGAEISDIEFVQFHPTALHVENAPRFLLSEALRGEGAYLRNAAGERFMEAYHPLGELAPRDVVSRAVVEELRRSGAPHVFLDLRHLPAGFVAARFPRIYQTCLQYGVDLSKDLVPVHPAAHYAMGGVRTDLNGATSLPRLFAAGEAACTAVHGANRLASNSLLEGVVFGARAGAAMRDTPQWQNGTGERPPALFPLLGEQQLRQLMWRHCGIIREGAELRQLVRQLDSVEMVVCSHAARVQHELRNLHVTARLIACCALAREESRGAHFRSDFPHPRPEFEKHSIIDWRGDVRFA